MHNVPKSKVAVYAYCANNLGDDLFITMLLDRYPETQFDFFAGTDRDLATIKGRANARIIDYAYFKRHKRDYDLFLVLGGSMFQEIPGWTRLWLSYARRFVQCKAANVPIAVVGASFGPAFSLTFRFAFAGLFGLCAWISFRDQQSLAAIPWRRHVNWYPDLAFAYEIPQATSDGSIVGLSVMRLGTSPHRQAAARASYARLIEEITSFRPMRLFSFQESDAISDVEEIYAVLRMVPSACKSHVEVVKYDPTQLKEFLTAFSECSTFISTRFHSMVLAILARQELYILAYHEKIPNTLSSIGADFPMFDAEKLALSVDDIRCLLQSGDLASGQLDITPLSRGAQKHFTLLDRLLSPSRG